MTALSTPIPELPYEVLQDIFELAVSSYEEVAHALHLMLVCRQVRHWVRPVLYRKICLPMETPIPSKAVSKLLASHSEIFSNVRSLCVTHYASKKEAKHLLEAAREATRLALWLDDTDWEMVRTIKQLPLRELSTEGTYMEALVASTPVWLNNLTHLQLIFWTNKNTPNWEMIFSALPHLTHVHLHVYSAARDKPEEVRDVILNRCPIVKTIVITLRPKLPRAMVNGVEIVTLHTVHTLHGWQNNLKSVWEVAAGMDEPDSVEVSQVDEEVSGVDEEYF